MKVTPQSGIHFVLALVLAVLAPTAVAESDMDRLVAVLIAKGLLTQAEATEVLGELHSTPLQAEERYEQAPAVKRLRVSGDLRSRYQSLHGHGISQQAGLADETAAVRMRARLGLDLTVDDHWSVGLGLASGGSDPRSTNQTFSGGFPTYDARIDYAYARYGFGDQASVAVGKFKNPLWTVGELLWDSDIRTEGVMASYALATPGAPDMTLHGGVLILNDKESNTSKSAYMYLLQAHMRFALASSLQLDLAPTYYHSRDLQGTPGLTEHAVASNTRDADGNLKYAYDAATLSANLTWHSATWLKQVEWFGEYVHATDPANANTGWFAGTRFGTGELTRLGDWRFEYGYRRLERDAWPEFLQDSDFLHGATSVKGSEIQLSLALGPKVSFGVDYYLNNEVIGLDADQDLLQVDLNLAW